MADLKDVIDKLTNEGDLIRNKGAHSIKSVKEILLSNQETPAQKKQDREDTRNFQKSLLDKMAGSAGAGAGITPEAKDKKTGGMFSKIGAGIGAAAAGSALLKSAAGIAAMGVAIPAFFVGLLAGDATLSWMKSIGADFKFKSLKAAAVGFSDIIISMDIKAFAVLGTIMAISITNY